MATLVRHINETMPELEAKIVEGFCSTDRKISGTRLISPGKGRHGNRIKVRRRNDRAMLLDHNAAETYRTNAEVERWIERVEGGWTPTPINAYW